MFQWNRSNTLPLSRQSCPVCFGVGMVFGERKDPHVCTCVLQAIFKACYARFKKCVKKDRGTNGVRLERIVQGRSTAVTFGRKNEEYIADFVLTAQRVLTPFQQKLFRYHYILGADLSLICRRLDIKRGSLVYFIGQIEAIMGAACAEVEPYPLFPLDQYFSPACRGERVAAIEVLVRVDAGPVRPPLAQRAGL